MNAKLHDLKQTRALGAELTERGAKLYDMLGKEPELHAARQQALRFLDNMSGNLDSHAEHAAMDKQVRGRRREGREEGEGREGAVDGPCLYYGIVCAYCVHSVVLLNEEGKGWWVTHVVYYGTMCIVWRCSTV